MALTVEDGTGLAAADSYESAADTVGRLVAEGYSALFGAPVERQEQRIRRATRQIDGWLRQFVNGRRRTSGQSLLFPRIDCWNRELKRYDSDEVPECVKRSVALRAEDLEHGVDPGPPAGISEESMQVEGKGRASRRYRQTRKPPLQRESPEAYREAQQLMWVGDAR